MDDVPPRQRELAADGGLSLAPEKHQEALHMKTSAAILAMLTVGMGFAQEAKVTTLMSKELTENPGKEATMIVVDYPPGSSDPIHRHNAHALLYVLEGSIVMQLKGGKQVTLSPGQTFYEGPEDEHIVGRNASKTKPARFVVVLIKEKGAPVLIPVK
jgi:quercetin dioxygenase-like cupin family protein